ncbi:hypothetical protein [Acetivibrio saccincola]|uniref:hypothetical protein n=1 Tax=Acetivibrio saccincola TaxID=1677857 RepID=UPI002CC4F7AC|nr:hypothetical protein [Acetivibrio saccincola]HQD28801.1 hypothetical protein [Acetivibrio saccincola]
MEELLVNSGFRYMTDEEMEEILNTLPEIIRDNYHGVGRTDNNGSGYVLLTCKSGGKRLPEDTSLYQTSFNDINEWVLEDSQGKEIGRFSKGIYANYYNNKDILFIAVGETTPNIDQIITIKRFQLSGNHKYIKNAKEVIKRGNSLFELEVYPQIAVTMIIDGISINEYVLLEETLIKGMKEKLDSIEKTNCDTSTLIVLKCKI